MFTKKCRAYQTSVLWHGGILKSATTRECHYTRNALRRHLVFSEVLNEAGGKRYFSAAIAIYRRRDDDNFKQRKKVMLEVVRGIT